MYALLKTGNIVRIVSENSLNNVYGVMMDKDEIYNESKIVNISQDDVIEIERNISVLTHRSKSIWGNLNATN